VARAEAAHFTASFDRALDEEQERQLPARGRETVTDFVEGASHLCFVCSLFIEWGCTALKWLGAGRACCGRGE
jgi:hypothetical protein